MDSTTTLYFREIRKYPVLTPIEELELTKKIANGDQDAKEKFIKCNLRLVVSVAKRYTLGKFELLDLVQEGNLGLIKAVEMYDYTKGIKFSSYATWWIKKYIFKFIDDNINDNNSLNKLVSFENEENELIFFIKDPNLTPEELSINNAEKDLLELLISNSNLNKLEETVIRMRFDFEHDTFNSLEKIAKKLKKPKSRVRIIEATALRKMRYTAQNNNMDFFI